MKLLVDTHLLLWLALGSSKLSTQARTVIEDAGNSLFFSASCSIRRRTISRSIESSSSGLESTCIFSRAEASSIRSIALSGRKRSVM